MKKAKWIWLNTAEKADEYAVFKDEFVYEDGAVCADISVAGDYALYINDKLVSFGQYADYAKRKVYEPPAQYLSYTEDSDIAKSQAGY